MVNDNKKYYQTRGRAGEEQRYASSAQLLKKAYEYFAWCEHNPYTKQELMKSGEKKGSVVDIPLGRPFTEVGLCVFCGISQESLSRYEQKEDFKQAVIHIRNIINQEQTEGAALGLYNASVVARLQEGDENKDVYSLQYQPIIIHVSLEQTKEEVARLQQQLGGKPTISTE